MALFVKVRHTFGHRWMPFFLPVAASLVYVLLAVLLVPDSFTGKSKSSAADDDDLAPAASASSSIDPAARAAAARRRLRPGSRGLTQPGAPMSPGVTPPPVVAPPPAPGAAPASPDGND
jgi:hypothetical protein